MNANNKKLKPEFNVPAVTNTIGCAPNQKHLSIPTNIGLELVNKAPAVTITTNCTPK